MKLILSRSAWSSIVRWSAESSVEEWGFLLGKRLGRNPMISRATRFDAGRHTKRGITVSGARARQEEERLREQYPETPPVGAWHSHPWGRDVLSAYAIQLSDTDKRCVGDGIVEMIVAVLDGIPSRPVKQHNDLLVRRWKGKTCRVEAWVRMKRRFLPLDIEAR